MVAMGKAARRGSSVFLSSHNFSAFQIIQNNAWLHTCIRGYYKTHMAKENAIYANVVNTVTMRTELKT
jgi:hypothetical protein